MTNSRKQVIAQIEIMNKILHNQQNSVARHKHFIMENRINHRTIIGLIIIIPAFLLGWRLARGKMFGAIAKHVTSAGLLAVSTHVQKQLVDALKQKL